MPGAIPFNFLAVQQKLLKIFQNEDDTWENLLGYHFLSKYLLKVLEV